MAEKTKAINEMVEQIGSMTVLELSQMVKALEEAFGVSAAMPMAAAPAAAAEAAPAQAAEKAEYKVTLKDTGSEKIKVLKAIRAVLPNLGLTEAKKMVEETPSVIAEAAPKADAMKMKESLEAAGAKVELS